MLAKMFVGYVQPRKGRFSARIENLESLTRNCSGAVICVGGPALTYYLTPTEEELFKKYNPDLQRKSLERRAERQEEFDHFVTKLKEYSKSDKPSTFCPGVLRCRKPWRMCFLVVRIFLPSWAIKLTAWM